MSSEAGRIALAAPFVLAGTLLVRAAAASVSSKVARPDRSPPPALPSIQFLGSGNLLVITSPRALAPVGGNSEMTLAVTTH